MRRRIIMMIKVDSIGIYFVPTMHWTLSQTLGVPLISKTNALVKLTAF